MSASLISSGNEDSTFIVPFHYSINQLLAEYLDIDLTKLEEEKDQMLEKLRVANAS